MPTIAGFFWPDQFFAQTFWTKEFRAVERGAGYRTEVDLYGGQFAQEFGHAVATSEGRPPAHQHQGPEVVLRLEASGLAALGPSPS
jgi:hypothetical protein